MIKNLTIDKIRTSIFHSIFGNFGLNQALFSPTYIKLDSSFANQFRIDRVLESTIEVVSSAQMQYFGMGGPLDCTIFVVLVCIGLFEKNLKRICNTYSICLFKIGYSFLYKENIYFVRPHPLNFLLGF